MSKKPRNPKDPGCRSFREKETTIREKVYKDGGREESITVKDSATKCPGDAKSKPPPESKPTPNNQADPIAYNSEGWGIEDTKVKVASSWGGGVEDATRDAVHNKWCPPSDCPDWCPPSDCLPQEYTLPAPQGCLPPPSTELCTEICV